MNLCIRKAGFLIHRLKYFEKKIRVSDFWDSIKVILLYLGKSYTQTEILQDIVNFKE